MDPRRTFAAAAVAVSLSAAAGASPAGGRAATSAPVTVVALGDSLTSGHRLAEKDAYPAILEARLAEAGYPARVVNHGVSGDTTAGGVRRLTAALAERPQVLIVELGANDGLRGVPVADVRANLERILDAAQAQNIKVVLCAMDALPVNGWQYTIDFHNLYFDLAKRYNVPLVPFLLNGVLGNRELMSSDGVHPNREGAKVLADTMFPYVKDVVAGALARNGS